MVTVLGVQIITMFVLFTTTFLCGNIPLLIACRSSNSNRNALRSSRRSESEIEEIGGDGDEEAVTQLHQSQASISATFTEKIVSFLLFFGGGVLFTTCFLHLLPEVREAFETEKKTGDNQEKDRKYPVAELITSGGFFIVYFIEEIAHRFFHKKPHSNQLQKNPNAVPVTHLHHNSDNDGQDEDESSRCILSDINVQTLNYGSLDDVVVTQREQHIVALANGSQEESMFNSIIIVIALSFHSIFEGMAIGLQDTIAHVWQLAVAVGTHKLVITFTIGVELLKDTKSTKKIIVHLLIFALMTPLGIALAATVRLKVDELTVGILSAIATGSLLYITFLHILAKEKLSSPLPGLIQYLGVLCGFGAMAVLQYLTEPFDRD